MSELVINNLQVSVEETEILKGVNLTIKSGEVHAVNPGICINGSSKVQNHRRGGNSGWE